MFWTHMKHLAEQRTSNRTPACNSRFSKAGVSCFYDSEVLNSSFVHLMKYSAKNPRLRKAPNRCRQARRTEQMKIIDRNVFFIFFQRTGKQF